MATRSRNGNGTAPEPTREKNAPVFKRRCWTGAGAVETAVFEKEKDGIVSYFVAVRRTWKNDDGYAESNLFSPHELLILADQVQQAHRFIDEQNNKD